MRNEQTQEQVNIAVKEYFDREYKKSNEYATAYIDKWLKDELGKEVQKSILNIFERSRSEDMEMIIFRMSIFPYTSERDEPAESLNKARKLMESLLTEIIENELDKDRLREDYITKIVARINDNQVVKK